MANKRIDGLVTTEYLLNKYEIEQKLNWDKRIIGWLLNSGLIKGRRSSKNITLIDEASFVNLINYRNSMLENQKLKIKQ